MEMDGKLNKTTKAIGWFNLTMEEYLLRLEISLDRFPNAKHSTKQNDNGTYDFIVEG